LGPLLLRKGSTDKPNSQDKHLPHPSQLKVKSEGLILYMSEVHLFDVEISKIQFEEHGADVEIESTTSVARR